MIQLFWDWTDFGFVLKIYTQNEFSDYKIAIDIQILWFELWIQLFKKFNYNDTDI
jgi:hypothetical protein